MVLCNSCLEIFNDNIIPKVQGLCPKVNCKGALMEFDEMLAPVVVLLYKKGYRHIENSCSGHAHRPDKVLHICFNDNVLIDDCPEEWETVHSGDKVIICKNIETQDLHKRQMEIFKGLMQLWEWAKSLDNCF